MKKILFTCSLLCIKTLMYSSEPNPNISLLQPWRDIIEEIARSSRNTNPSLTSDLETLRKNTFRYSINSAFRKPAKTS